MASTAIPPSLRSLFCQHRTPRFLTCRRNLLDRPCSNQNADSAHRFPNRPNFLPHPLHSSLSFCSRSPLSHSSICSLFRPRSPPIRSPLSSMTNPQATTGSPQSPPTKTVKVVVKGRVQGVFYRDWTVENATQLGLKGWIRNRRDGSVEALFSGDPHSVQTMEQRCRRGPPDAVVTRFEVFPCTDDPGTGFIRKPTV